MAALDFKAFKERILSVAKAVSFVYKAATEDEETLTICAAFFDDISQVNKSRETDYPLFLMKPPPSTQDPVHDPHDIYTLEFFIFFLEDDADADERVVFWNKARAIGRQFLEDLQKSAPTGEAQDIRIVGEISKDNGIHKVHSDQLVGVGFIVPLRVFTGECIEI